MKFGKGWTLFKILSNLHNFTFIHMYSWQQVVSTYWAFFSRTGYWHLLQFIIKWVGGLGTAGIKTHFIFWHKSENVWSSWLHNHFWSHWHSYFLDFGYTNDYLVIRSARIQQLQCSDVPLIVVSKFIGSMFVLSYVFTFHNSYWHWQKRNETMLGLESKRKVLV